MHYLNFKNIMVDQLFIIIFITKLLRQFIIININIINNNLINLLLTFLLLLLISNIGFCHLNYIFYIIIL